MIFTRPSAPVTRLHPRCHPRRGDRILARLGLETLPVDVLAVAASDGTLMVRAAAPADGASHLLPPEAAIRVLLPAPDRRRLP